MSWNTDTQFGPSSIGASGVMMEGGAFQAASGDISGATLSIPTRFTRVVCGHGRLSDGRHIIATTGATSNGVVAWTMLGIPIDTTPIADYVLFGR